MSKYNHAYSFWFEVPSSFSERGSDVTPKMLREALHQRLNRLSDEEILGACSILDSYEEELGVQDIQKHPFARSISDDDL